MTMTISRAAMDALRNGISKYERLGDGGVLRGHMLEILDRCTVVESGKVVYQCQGLHYWFDMSESDYLEVHQKGEIVRGETVITPHMTRKLYSALPAAMRNLQDVLDALPSDRRRRVEKEFRSLTAASAEAQTFGTFGHIGVDKSPLTHAAARASTSPALREVTEQDVKDFRYFFDASYGITFGSNLEALSDEALRLALEAFRHSLSTKQE